MIKRITSWVLVGAFALSTFAACQSDTATLSSSDMLIETSAATNTAVAAVEPTVALAIASSPSATESVVVPTALAENSQAHETASAPVEASAAVQIVLAGDAITVDGDGVTVDGSRATITAAGVYSLSGALADGQIVVDTTDEGPVQLILNGVELASSSSAPLTIANAGTTEIILADGTTNTITDGASYVFADPAEDEPNAALFSKSDLTISGSGSLVVTGNYNDGIASKDGLVIAGGVITVDAVDDGIRGKDYLVVENGAITVRAQGDGLKSDNEEDAAKGYIAIQNGVITVTAGGDAITAETDVLISDGQFALTSGGGGGSFVDETASAKGIKGGVSVTIDGGDFTVDAADDALHANDSLTINGGVFTLASGDDAVHADATLTINDGEIEITDSYEGIESALITLNGGDIALVSSDDGINVAGGNDGSGMNARPGRGGGPGQAAVTYTGNNYLRINGGNILVNAAGDGIDVNGAIEMTGGVVIVNGPTENMNGALDYDGTFNISGGYLAAAGSSGMVQAPGTASSQYSVLLNFPSMLPAGTMIHMQTADGDSLLTIAPLKAFQSIAFSAPALAEGDTIEVYYGGSASEALDGGLYQGPYTPGEQIASFTIANVVTVVGNSVR